MYFSFANHFYHLLHYFIGFSILFLLYPVIVFPKIGGARAERIMANFMHMVLLFILTGYFLAAVQLFEFIGLMIVMTVIYGYYFFQKNSSIYAQGIVIKVKMYFFDYLDNARNVPEDISHLCEKIKISLRERVKVFVDKREYVFAILFCLVLGFAIYLRYYDSIVNAAPDMSDSSVTLAWMKYVNSDQLFHDGIYPQGFYIFLATLQKFAAIDPVYIIKYTGSLYGIITSLTLYFVISRLTKKPYVGFRTPHKFVGFRDGNSIKG
jgi:hypothetical protein